MQFKTETNITQMTMFESRKAFTYSCHGGNLSIDKGATDRRLAHKLDAILNSRLT